MINITYELILIFLYTGTVKCHNVCKHHISTNNNFKQTEHAIFLCVISMG